MLRFLAVLLALLFPALAAAAPAKAPPVVILISFDGFRPDYLDRGVTPNLSRLAERGVRGAMRPSFPSKTFPNHWTLVTGMVPDHHGIVGNRMEDPARPGERFTMDNDDPFWWNQAEPVWVAAERAGIRTATMFWPGSNVGWGGQKGTGYAPVQGGVRPADWQQFNQAITSEQRVNVVLDWLRRPSPIRPRLITLYFDTIDTAGHEFGPDDPRTTAAVAEADRTLGRLLGGMAALKVHADLVIVSDHGMAPVSSERTIALDRLADPALYRIIEAGPYAAIEPTPGNTEKLWAILAVPGEHHRCWRKGEVPARLRYGTHPRTPSILCLAESGWTLEPTAPTKAYARGAHGFDPAAPEMASLFIAHGPSFTAGKRVEPFDNVSVAPLLRALLGLPQNPAGDGTLEPLNGVLRQ